MAQSAPTRFSLKKNFFTPFYSSSSNKKKGTTRSPKTINSYYEIDQFFSILIEQKKNDIKKYGKERKSSLFFGSIMAVFLHQIHLK